MRILAVMLVLATVACSGGDQTTTTTGMTGGVTPEEAVEGVFSAIRQHQFDGAARFTDATQMRFILVVEGGSVDDALVADPDVVSVNFWRAFADALGPEGLSGLSVQPESAHRFEVGDTHFASVRVSIGGTARVMLVKEDEQGWKVDVLGSFVEVLGGRYGQAADQILESPTAAELVPELRSQADSLAAVVEITPGNGQLHQNMLALVNRLEG